MHLAGPPSSVLARKLQGLAVHGRNWREATLYGLINSEIACKINRGICISFPGRFVEIRVISSVLAIVTTVWTAVNNGYLMSPLFLSLSFSLRLRSSRELFIGTMKFFWPRLMPRISPVINYNRSRGLTGNRVSHSSFNPSSYSSFSSLFLQHATFFSLSNQRRSLDVESRRISPKNESL